jgi:epoxyqueuosine reductase
MNISTLDLHSLAEQIKQWGRELGFEQVGIADVDLSDQQIFLDKWLSKGFHGEMDYMARHGTMRSQPEQLVPGSLRIISVRMDYLPPDAKFAEQLADKSKGYISRYAFGRDYHKVMRKKLKMLGEKIQQQLGDTEYRPFVDSAPILEHAAAQKAGVGWTGKHSLTINNDAGSWFFLGELLINLPLPVDAPAQSECGSCVACMTACPTGAIVEPYVVDARKCISYLTIEYKGVIPEALRPLMGNRIYGCDDCQLVCPWNRFAQITSESDFHLRDALIDTSLLSLLNWDEDYFMSALAGSPIRRIGFEQWQRNIVIALGNGPYSQEAVDTLTELLEHASSVVKEHALWALAQLHKKHDNQSADSEQFVEVVDKSERQKMRLIRTVQKGLPRDA